jgi:hypothetical protein
MTRHLTLGEYFWLAEQAALTAGAVLASLDSLDWIIQMTETPQTQKKEPPPRPPRQPDPKLITYLERGQGDRKELEEPQAGSRKS